MILQIQKHMKRRTKFRIYSTSFVLTNVNLFCTTNAPIKHESTVFADTSELEHQPKQWGTSHSLEAIKRIVRRGKIQKVTEYE